MGDTFGAPQESITHRKQEKLIATAETYLQTCPDPPEEWRIDLIAVRVDRKGAVGPVEHMLNAVELG